MDGSTGIILQLFEIGGFVCILLIGQYIFSMGKKIQSLFAVLVFSMFFSIFKISSLRAFDIMFILFIVTGFLYSDNKKTLNINKHYMGFFILSSFILLPTITGDHKIIGLFRNLHLVLYVIYSYLIYQLLLSEKISIRQISNLLFKIILLTLFLCIIQVAGFLNPQDMPLYFGMIRASGGFLDANTLGLYAISCCLIVLSQMDEAAIKRKITIIATFIIIILSGSRGSLVSFIVCLVLLKFNKNLKAAFIIVILIFLVMGYFITDIVKFSLNLLPGITSFYTQSAFVETSSELNWQGFTSGRLGIWTVVFEILEDFSFKDWIIGRGMFSSGFLIADKLGNVDVYKSSHNALLQLIVDTGLLGTILFYSINLGLVYFLYKKSVLLKNNSQRICIHLLVALISVLIWSLFAEILFHGIYWTLLSIIIYKKWLLNTYQLADGMKTAFAVRQNILKS